MALPHSDTYSALVSKDGIRWLGPAPAAVSEGGSVLADIVVREAAGASLPLPGPGADGQAVVALFDRIAESGAFADVEDPVEWQRQQREDRAL